MRNLTKNLIRAHCHRMVSALKRSQAHRDHVLASKAKGDQHREQFTIDSFQTVVTRKREEFWEAKKEAERLREMERDTAFQHAMIREIDKQVRVRVSLRT